MMQSSAKRRAPLGIGTARRALSLSILLGVLLIGGALHAAQLVVVDVKPLATAYRTSRIIGASDASAVYKAAVALACPGPPVTRATPTWPVVRA